MCSHVPDKGQQMVRYYGFYSNVCRGKRKKAKQDDIIPAILPAPDNAKSPPEKLGQAHPENLYLVSYFPLTHYDHAGILHSPKSNVLSNQGHDF